MPAPGEFYTPHSHRGSTTGEIEQYARAGSMKRAKYDAAIHGEHYVHVVDGPDFDLRSGDNALIWYNETFKRIDGIALGTLGAFVINES
jgi:hypothetical protein